MTPFADPIHVVSVSGGKDSTATWLLADKQFPGQVVPVFADTGNEHEATYEYLAYLEVVMGQRIHRLKADFSDRIANKRRFVQEKWPLHGVPDAKVEEALATLVPSGNPYLDLCIWKGRFPSRMAQFCTQELKTIPLVEFQMWWIDTLCVDVWSWQGVRRDESFNRRNAKGFESVGGGLYVWRPIAGWSAQVTVDFVVSCGVKLNPLYQQGMKRVGCMPCINASKNEVAEIARRFPEHIDRIGQWERIVASASKRNAASFFPAPNDGRADIQGRNILERVEWSKTKYGGKDYNPAWDEPAPACSSSYGLCE